MANRRRRRNPARYLAPLALAAIIVGVYVIVQATLHTSHATTTQSQTTGTTTTVHNKISRTRKYYFVHPNDTLSSIASKTGVSLSTLESLNPSVNPTALQTGQRLLLRR